MTNIIYQSFYFIVVKTVFSKRLSGATITQINVEVLAQSLEQAQNRLTKMGLSNYTIK